MSNLLIHRKHRLSQCFPTYGSPNFCYGSRLTTHKQLIFENNFNRKFIQIMLYLISLSSIIIM